MVKLKQCIICGKPRKATMIASHKNKLLNDQFVICRECINKLFDLNDKETTISVCQLMNIPYVESVIQKNRIKNNGFAGYLKTIAPSKKYQVFTDSEFTVTNETVAESEKAFEITPDIVKRWGSGYDKDEYYSFETSLKRLMDIKKPNTQFELMRYIKNVQLEIAFNNSLKDGESKAITTLRKSYSEDLKDLGFDSVLNSDDGNELNLGQRIHNWENNEPVPDMKELDDVADIKKYINKWFVIPMKRVFGLADEKEVATLYNEE